MLIQLIPHSFKGIDDKSSRHQFLVGTCDIISKALKEKTTICEYEPDFDFGSWGSIYLEDTEEEIYLCRDYWRVEYPFHYAQLVINNDGVLTARNRCYEIAKVLGGNYSHYCSDYFYDSFMEKDCLLEEVLNDAREYTEPFPAEYLSTHPWEEVNGHFGSHYDDNFEVILTEKHYNYIDRIEKMEKILLSLVKPVYSLIEDIEENRLSQEQIQQKKEILLPQIKVLAAYYHSDDWQEDCDAKNRGIIPPTESYSVLCETEIFEFLDDIEKWIGYEYEAKYISSRKDLALENSSFFTGYKEKKIVNADNIILDLGVLMKPDISRCRNVFRRFMDDRSIYQILGLDNPNPKGTLIDAYNRGMRTETFIQEVLKHSMAGTSKMDVIFAWNNILSDIPDVMWEQIKDLRSKGYRIFLLANTNSWHWFDTEMRYDPHIEESFDDIFLSYEMHSCKPEEQIFKEVDIAIGADPKRTIYVDDTTVNREAAERYVGWRSNCWNMKSLLMEIEANELADAIVAQYKKK